jgi:NAD(P)-dependent dehydrogenase (short-subunit alcohol dehydrogenase family)
VQRFQRRSVIVTGSGHGIGRAIARPFAAEGAGVVIADLDQAVAALTTTEIVAAGGAIAMRVAATGSDGRRQRPWRAGGGVEYSVGVFGKSGYGREQRFEALELNCQTKAIIHMVTR